MYFLRLFLNPTSLVTQDSISLFYFNQAEPGTLGGFSGGGNSGILRSEVLFTPPRPLDICDLNNYCADNRTHVHRSAVNSWNLNGPGSGSLRVYPFDIQISAKSVIQVQEVRTAADCGQTIGGHFTVSYKDFTSTAIPYDASRKEFMDIVQRLNIGPLKGIIYYGSRIEWFLFSMGPIVNRNHFILLP